MCVCVCVCDERFAGNSYILFLYREAVLSQNKKKKWGPENGAIWDSGAQSVSPTHISFARIPHASREPRLSDRVTVPTYTESPNALLKKPDKIIVLPLLVFQLPSPPPHLAIITSLPYIRM